MRITIRSERMDTGGVHNDRHFELENASHIDKEKSKNNIYWNYLGDPDVSFKDAEVDFYRKHFSAHLKRQKFENMKHYKKGRDLTVLQYYKRKNHCPEDVILQLGDKTNHASAEDLWKCAQEYAETFDRKYGKYCKILTMALHVDEATPHVHIRRAWIGHDRWGNEHESQAQALKELCLENQMNDKSRSKYINPKTRFTHDERELFVNICKEQLPEIEFEVNPREKRPRISTNLYKKVAQDVEKNYQKSFEMMEHTRLRLEHEVKTLEDNVKREEEARKKAEEDARIAREQTIRTEQMIYSIFEHEAALRRKYRDKMDAFKKLDRNDRKRRDIIKEMYQAEFGRNILK